MRTDRVQSQAATFTAALSSHTLLQAAVDNDSAFADGVSATSINVGGIAVWLALFQQLPNKVLD